jgi:hypothetical protein
MEVDMTQIAGRWANAWWFDPRSGRASFLGVWPTRGTRTFSSRAGDSVLVLDDAALHLGPPGLGATIPVPAVTPPSWAAEFTLGQTKVLEHEDSGNNARLVAQAGTLEVSLERLVHPVTRGDPESALRWTCKSAQLLSTELLAQGIRISDRTCPSCLRPRL